MKICLVLVRCRLLIENVSVEMAEESSQFVRGARAAERNRMPPFDVERRDETDCAAAAAGVLRCLHTASATCSCPLYFLKK